MVEAHVIDLLPGYALGILEEAELLQVARHLPQCAACRKELETCSAAVDQLVFAAPLQTPPPNLKAGVLGRVERESRAAVKQARRESTVPAARWPGWLQSIGLLLAGRGGLAAGVIGLLLIALLGINNVILWQRVNDLQASLPPENVHIVRLNGTANAPQTAGYVMVFRDEKYGSLAVENAPALEAGYQYQIWLIQNGVRTSGGVFSVNQEGYGTLQVASPRPLDTFQSFGITIEPAGGSPQPTGKKILGGNL